MVDRILTSPWFLACTAACSAASVAGASWLAGGVGAVAFVLGIAFALALMLVVAWALTAEHAPAVDAARPAPAPAPTKAAAVDELVRRLDDGHALRAELEPGATDVRVSAWIDGARETVERDGPDFAGYFNALTAHAYADDCERLDAHLRRLTTIVRARSEDA